MRIAILGNGQPYAIKKEINNHDLVIATDGGANYCIKYKIKPDLIIGDFDSIKEQTKKVFSDVEWKEQKDQNTTDTEKALNFIKEKYGDQIKQVDLYWMASLQRIDHTMATIFMMAGYFELPLTFKGKNFDAQIISGEKELNNKKGQTVSLFPFSGDFTAPIMKGFQWQMDFSPDNKKIFSISNKIIDAEANITIPEGMALLIINKEGKWKN
ncbi:thiamine diphosphokinase [Patescibacteria group bacterium]|nr:thiamine diphosphokinase [Patescibacteria group bacterium]MBU1673729.1 thiamine diphosphokinase [Patescibacteria group bacterium]MBU1963096.1 thiamine diphosphokinase [Patescibacteria group bacterium]